MSKNQLASRATPKPSLLWLFLISGVEIVSAANHLLVVLSIYSTKSELTVIKIRSFKNLNLDNLLIDLNDVPWHTVKIMDNVEDSWHMWNFFFAILLMRKWLHYESHGMNITQKPTRMGIPTLRNHVTELARKSKANLYKSAIQNSKGDSKTMLSHVNKLFPKTKSSVIPSLEINGRLITTPKDLAHTFDPFFVKFMKTWHIWLQCLSALHLLGYGLHVK